MRASYLLLPIIYAHYFIGHGFLGNGIIQIFHHNQQTKCHSWSQKKIYKIFIFLGLSSNSSLVWIGNKLKWDWFNDGWWNPLHWRVEKISNGLGNCQWHEINDKSKQKRICLTFYLPLCCDYVIKSNAHTIYFKETKWSLWWDVINRILYPKWIGNFIKIHSQFWILL